MFVPAEDTCMLETLEVFETYGDGMELPLGLRAVGVPGLTRGVQALLAPCQGVRCWRATSLAPQRVGSS